MANFKEGYTLRNTRRVREDLEMLLEELLDTELADNELLAIRDELKAAQETLTLCIEAHKEKGGE
jgi:hypothetical protein